jgi:hypothetical protein
MKTQYIASTLIALAAVASSSAFAGIYAPDMEVDAIVSTPFVSTVSREDVKAQTILWNQLHYGDDTSNNGVPHISE